MFKDATSSRKHATSSSQQATGSTRAAAPRTTGDVLWKGSDKELLDALQQLPDGHCDLTNCLLMRKQVDKLIAAIQVVAVHRISFGIVEDIDILLNAIPHSKVSEWNFFATERLGSKDKAVVFPNAGEVATLATAISQLEEHSHTKLIYLNAHNLDEAAREKLPSCFDATIKPVRLFDSSPQLTAPQPQPHSQVSPGAVTPSVPLDVVKTGLSGQQYGELLIQLVSAIGAGNLGATRALVKEQLAHCSREQFELCQRNARALALTKAGADAAQEILKLSFPVVAEPRAPSAAVDLPDLLVRLPKYISSGSSETPHPLRSDNGQLLPLSASQKDVLRNIAKNYLFDADESTKALAAATLDLLKD